MLNYRIVFTGEGIEPWTWTLYRNEQTIDTGYSRTKLGALRQARKALREQHA